MSRSQKAFYYIMLASIIVCWLPLKSLAYLLPLVCLAFYLIYTKDIKICIRLYLILFLWFILFILHQILADDFVIQSAILTLITYGGLLFLIAVPSKYLSSRSLYYKLLPVVKVILVIECTIGLIQGLYGVATTGTFDGSTGDFIEGTIHPFLRPEMAFSNPMFATNIVFLLLFLFPSISKRNRSDLLIFLYASFVLVLASVIHVLLFIFLGTVGAYLYIDSKKFFKIRNVNKAIPILFIPLIFLITQPQNFNLIRSHFFKLFGGEFPRAIVTIRSITELPEQNKYMPVIGLGAGQFTSRASLISTGRYLGGYSSNPNEVFFFSGKMSPHFRKHVLDLWIASNNRAKYGGGSTVKPYYSWLSVYTEFGLIGLLTIVFFTVKLVKDVKRKIQSKFHKKIAVSFISGAVFLFLLGGQENYWEIPQAIFIGILALKFFYSMLAKESAFKIVGKKVDLTSNT